MCARVKSNSVLTVITRPAFSGPGIWSFIFRSCIFSAPLKLWPEVGLLVTSPLVGVAEYCDDRVCLPACTHIFTTIYSIFTTFCACYTLPTSCFMHDVIFAYAIYYYFATRLKSSTHTAFGLTVNGAQDYRFRVMGGQVSQSGLTRLQSIS